MNDWNNRPFNIDFVVEQDIVPLGIKTYRSGSEISFNCPFCEKAGLPADTKHKYSVNVDKDAGHCFRCGASHGLLSLHQALVDKPLTLEEARVDLMKRFNGLPSDVQTKITHSKERIQEENKRQLETASLQVRDDVYRKFLNQLTLSKAHYNDLIRRGLTPEEIKNNGYKSVPVVGNITFAKNAMSSYDTWKAIKNHYKWGIPGFYDIRSDEPKCVALKNGYFVPVRTIDPDTGLIKISGMQIRYDDLPKDATKEEKEHYAKYKWFTSNFKTRNNGSSVKDGCSASGCENIHFAGDWVHVPKQVILTEGALKADVSASLIKRCTGKSVAIMGLVGVYNTSQLIEALFYAKDRGCEEILIAVDMDYREKPQVKLAMQNIIKIIDNSGIRHNVFNWNPAYKGLDDYFLGMLHHQQSSTPEKFLVK